MSEITLSICIPTYNRADFLDYLLGQTVATWNFGFPYEIVVTDNASTDDTEAVVRRHADRSLPIRYYRQTENKGGGPNLLTAFHRARGQYVLYLADDDLLIPEGVEAALAVLRHNPGLRALYAPWQLYDDIDKVSMGDFYAIPGDVVFGPGQEDELFNLITRRYIFPEIVIYRADAVRRILTWPRFCFWAFALLADTIAQGPVTFVQRPYYRSVIRSPVRPSREQSGVEEAMTGWDLYRGGLEYFLYAMLKNRGTTLTAENRRAANAMIDAFVIERMRVALRLWIARGDYLAAYDLACRLSLRDPALVRDVPGIDRLPLMLVMQKLARFANAIGGVDRLELVGVEQAAEVMALLRQAGLETRIALNAGSAPPVDAPRETTIVYLAQEAGRGACGSLGYVPNLVVSEAELLSGLYAP